MIQTRKLSVIIRDFLSAALTLFRHSLKWYRQSHVPNYLALVLSSSLWICCGGYKALERVGAPCSLSQFVPLRIFPFHPEHYAESNPLGQYARHLVYWHLALSRVGSSPMERLITSDIDDRDGTVYSE